MDKYLSDYEATPFLAALKQSNMSRAEMQQNILEMILAGTDTSSVSLYYTILLLAENRSKSVRLLGSLLNDPKSAYTDYVLKEAMRLLPVGPVIIRQAVEDCVLSGGLQIKRGTNFVLHLARMNRDPSYFANPLEFVPERFADRAQTELFFPMGKGPKSCIGQYFAMVEMRQILVEFVKIYHVLRSSNNQCIHMRTKWDIAQQPILEERVLLLPKKHCFLVGANSVGKSTLAARLGNLLDCQVSTEKARQVLKEMNVTGKQIRSEPATCFRFQKEIIKRLAASDDGSYSNELVMFDSCVLDALIYAKYFLNTSKYEELLSMSETQLLMDSIRDPKSMVFLIKPNELCLQDDKVRMLPLDLKEWEQFSTCFEQTMTELDIKYYVIDSVGLNERTLQVLNALSF